MSKIYEIIIDKDKIIKWRLNGKPHSPGDIPAVICANGSKGWCQHGKPHRLTGPAVEWSNGKVEYWIEGKRLSKGEFKERIRCLKSTK